MGRRRPLSGKIAVLEERVDRLEAENALLRARPPLGHSHGGGGTSHVRFLDGDKRFAILRLRNAA